MTDSIVAAFHATSLLAPSAVFAEEGLQPITALDDTNTAAPGWIGDRWRPGGTLLVGINPGGGGDAYRGNATDARLYGLIQEFRHAEPGDQADALAAMSDAWIAIQATHNIRRIIDAVLDAVGEYARSSAFINVVPFRTRNDAAPRKTALTRAWKLASGPQVEALAPRRIVALGRKAYDALLQLGADRKFDVVLIKRSIGDSAVTADAREVLARLRSDNASPSSIGNVDARLLSVETRSTKLADRILQAVPSRHPLEAPHGIKSPGALAAHLHLLDAAARMNLDGQPHKSAITAVKLIDRQGRYLFSWIINAHHLLFYIRKPALKLAPSLAMRAQRSLSGVKVNPAGEVTVRLETAADAERLTSWLFDRETWADIAQLGKGSGGAYPMLRER